MKYALESAHKHIKNIRQIDEAKAEGMCLWQVGEGGTMFSVKN